MPDKRLIHAKTDVQRILRFADSLGLQLLPEQLGGSDDPRPRTLEELQWVSRGTILCFRPAWLFDRILLNYTDIGAFADTYGVRSSTNMCPISISFSGELDVAGAHRLGVGSISFKRDWLAEPAHEMRPTPPDVEPIYKQLCKHLLSGVVARGGGHVYHVCKEAAAVARRMETRPPFDYIEWPPPDLHKKSKR